MTMPPADRGQIGDSQEARHRFVPHKRTERRSLLPAGSRPSTLPPADLVDQAITRVSLVAIIVVTVAVLEVSISHLWPWLTRPNYPSAPEKWDLIGNLFVVTVSVLTWAATRWTRLETPTRLRIGTVYLLVIALLVSLTDHADHYWANGHRQHGIPWVSAIVLVFPIIVPMPPLRALVLGLLMAATSPLAMMAHVYLLGYSRPDAVGLLDAFPFLFAFVSAYVARVVQQLGTEVGRARQLGAYTLEQRIGAGGMGEVWSASHRFLARPAAIKLVRPAGHGAQRRTLPERFEREAQVTSTLKSPHTVQVYDFGCSDDGRLYYAMELLEGTDLESLVKQHGAQPPERVVYWLRQVCHSLAEAHDAGLVHRDIKPANLFVCHYGREQDFIKVLDFGLVSLVHPTEEAAVKLTAGDHVIGTPCCMPPEMATNRHPVDGRSDLYSLGCVAYFLLTGEHVFCAASAIEMVAGHVTKPPVPPSQKTPQPIPDALDRIVLACLEKVPDNRPQTADELLARLDACTLPELWTQSRARHWWHEIEQRRAGEPQ